MIHVLGNETATGMSSFYSTKGLSSSIVSYFECISQLFHFTVFFLGDWFVGCVHPCQVTRRIQWCVGNFSEDCNKTSFASSLHLWDYYTNICHLKLSAIILKQFWIPAQKILGPPKLFDSSNLLVNKSYCCVLLTSAVGIGVLICYIF